MKSHHHWTAAARLGLRGAALMLLTLSVLPAADGLSNSDRQAGIAQLERTRQGVIAATKGLSEAQWKFKAGPERWSVAETLEHIALSEDFFLDMISKKIMQAPAGKPDRDFQATDKLVLQQIADRSHKAQAPGPLSPTGRWSPQETLDHFLKTRARTEDFLKSTGGLRDHVADSPLGQPLDAYQWLLFSSAHSERHTAQMLEVKADPGFPAK
ncbi:DinB family protein [Paludibaculum fermentans]|uniref:DinB family protein n=1 Tax=Paludibaculum fermentans TaxID=1473598 RepID=A0A7S7NMU4_PALFE|nr:DinB family protein [Paludibaculum fermentans]QOY86546.1 DinB family protein [Paludibaculum fermentans]